MFNKVLIANRGEIASRVIRTCKSLGVKTVAVYSEADQEAPFVSEADESYLIGGPKVNESYLNIDAIVNVAKETNSEAVHPGYGLLSENTEFAKRLEDENIVFIGPDSNAINQMGSKLTARQTMEKAGVPIIPGTNDPVESVKMLNKLQVTLVIP